MTRTSKKPGDGQVYADGLLGHFVGTNVEDVLAHVEVGSLILEGLVAALQKDLVALFKCPEQDLLLDGAQQRLNYPFNDVNHNQSPIGSV